MFRWTDEAAEFLRAHYKVDMTPDEIATHLGVGLNALFGKAHRLGLSDKASTAPRRPRRPTVAKPPRSEAETVLAAGYAQGRPVAEIARDLRVSSSTVTTRASRLGISRPRAIGPVLRAASPYKTCQWVTGPGRMVIDEDRGDVVREVPKCGCPTHRSSSW